MADFRVPVDQIKKNTLVNTVRFQLHLPQIALWIAGVGLVALGLYWTSLYSFLLFHTLVELFSITISWGLFMLVWNARRWMNNSYLLVLGIALAASGGLDLVHTLAYKGMNIFAGYDTNLPTQLWIAARYLQSLSMLLASLFLTSGLPKTTQAARNGLAKPDQAWEYTVLAAYAAVTFLLLGLIFMRQFPVCYIEGQGLTPFKVISEYVISLILMASLVILWIKRKHFNRALLWLLIAATFTTILSELVFTSYVGVYGFSSLIGHYAKLAAFFLIYFAVIQAGLQRPYGLMFRELSQQTIALSESERYLQSVLQTTADGFWVVNIEGRMIEVNKAYCAMTGYTRAELLELSINDIDALEKPTETIARIKRIIASGSEMYEAQHRRKDGSIFDVEISVTHLDMDGGRFIGFCRDITKRKMAEEALRESEARFRSLFDNINEGVALHEIITDENGVPVDFVFLDVNPIYEILTKLNARDIIGKRGLDVIPNLEQKWIDLYGKVAQTGEPACIQDHSDYLDKYWEVKAYSPKPNQFAVALSDITERIQAEQRLQALSSRQQALLAAIPDIIMEVDTHKVYTWANQAGFLFYGEDVIGKEAADYFLGEQETYHAVQPLFDGDEEVIYVESWQRRCDGEERLLGWWCRVLKDNQGNPVGAVSTGRDITEQKLSEQSVREQESLLRTIAENYPNSYLSIIEKDLTVSFSSGQEFRKQNLDPHQFIGLTLEQIFGDQAEIVREHYLKTFIGAEQSFELFINNQHQFYRTVPLVAQDGSISRILSVVENITERKKTEEQLRLHSLVLNQIQDCVTVTDLEGRITYVNKAESRLLQRSAEELVGKSVETYGEDPGRGATQQEILTQTLTEGLWRGEVVNYAADGTDVILDTRTQVVRDSEGNPLALCGIGTDITERKLAEEQLRIALAEKETLLQELYHRTKNNMELISSMLYLQADATPDIPAAELAEIIEKKIRAMALAHQKLYQSKDLSIIDLGSYIHDFSELIMDSYQIFPSHVTLTTEVQSIPVLIDTAIPCGLILNELTTNALKYAFPDERFGEIRIRLFQDPDGVIELQVADNGVGAPPGFDFHAQKTLGMKIVIGIAEKQLGGKIEFENRPGLCCTFRFRDDQYNRRV